MTQTTRASVEEIAETEQTYNAKETKRRAIWKLLAPWIAGFGAILMLLTPVGGAFVIHDTQRVSQAQIITVKNEVTSLTKAFQCVAKAENGVLQDVRLAFANDKNPADYATIAKECKVPQTPAG